MYFPEYVYDEYGFYHNNWGWDAFNGWFAAEVFDVSEAWGHETDHDDYNAPWHEYHDIEFDSSHMISYDTLNY